MYRIIILIVAIMTLGLTAAFCSKANPKEVSIELSITQRELDRDTNLIKVIQNDIVTFNISSDEDGIVHIHGYDIKIKVGPNQPGILRFTPDATGGFPITLHAGAHENDDVPHDSHSMGHAELFESPTLNTGETFSFTIPPTHMTGTIFFHNHLNHDMTGEIKIKTSAKNSDPSQFEIRQDGSFAPQSLSVQPGTTIVWINKGDNRARPTSGKAPVEQRHGHDGSDESEHGDEITLGRLEVHPR